MSGGCRSIHCRREGAKENLISRGLANSTVLDPNWPAIDLDAARPFERATLERNRRIDEIAAARAENQ